ncbi:MAG: hypothetical protein EHM18_05920 [Acidobacteria bacterium]|nr:MAG: hypothetical protein EHM18_05920 [Acidobacteriota bacterium]
MRNQIVEVLSPLYFARVASFINRTRNLSNAEAETVVEEQAQVFELRKPYLMRLWKNCPSEIGRSEKARPEQTR